MSSATPAVLCAAGKLTPTINLFHTQSFHAGIRKRIVSTSIQKVTDVVFCKADRFIHFLGILRGNWWDSQCFRCWWLSWSLGCGGVYLHGWFKWVQWQLQSTRTLTATHCCWSVVLMTNHWDQTLIFLSRLCILLSLGKLWYACDEQLIGIKTWKITEAIKLRQIDENWQL